jgi:hypothetical protein
MLIDFSHLSTEADHRRQAMLADAENFRLAKLVKTAQRRAHHPVTPPAEPPRPREGVSGRRDRARRDPAQRNDDAERRYAVPR